MTIYIRNSWQDVLKEEFDKNYFKELQQFLDKEYRTQTIYPARENIFLGLEWTPFKNVKVVIMGQDPYPNEGEHPGPGFSVQPDCWKVPHSLIRIYKALTFDLGYPAVSHGYLKSWAEQGVLLLDSILTVRSGETLSHEGKGWETFTDEIIKKLSSERDHVVFILWGTKANETSSLINPKHTIISAVHPVFYSRQTPKPVEGDTFRVHKPFSRANAALRNHNQDPINWRLPDAVA